MADNHTRDEVQKYMDDLPGPTPPTPEWFNVSPAEQMGEAFGLVNTESALLAVEVPVVGADGGEAEVIVPAGGPIPPNAVSVREVGVNEAMSIIATSPIDIAEDLPGAEFVIGPREAVESVRTEVTDPGRRRERLETQAERGGGV